MWNALFEVSVPTDDNWKHWDTLLFLEIKLEFSEQM